LNLGRSGAGSGAVAFESPHWPRPPGPTKCSESARESARMSFEGPVIQATDPQRGCPAARLPGGCHPAAGVQIVPSQQWPNLPGDHEAAFLGKVALAARDQRSAAGARGRSEDRVRERMATEIDECPFWSAPNSARCWISLDPRRLWGPQSSSRLRASVGNRASGRLVTAVDVDQGTSASLRGRRRCASGRGATMRGPAHSRVPAANTALVTVTEPDWGWSHQGSSAMRALSAGRQVSGHA